MKNVDNGWIDSVGFVQPFWCFFMVARKDINLPVLNQWNQSS